MAETRKCPSGLRPSSRAFWKQTQAEFRLTDTPALTLLTQAAKAMDTADRAHEAMRKQPQIVVNDKGASIANPLIKVENDARASFYAAMRLLALDGSEEK